MLSTILTWSSRRSPVLLAYECRASRVRHLIHAYNIFKAADVFAAHNITLLPHLYQRPEAQGYALPGATGQGCSWECIRPAVGSHSLHRVGEAFTVVKNGPYFLVAERSKAEQVMRREYHLISLRPTPAVAVGCPLASDMNRTQFTLATIVS
jgi:hypothetical protein